MIKIYKRKDSFMPRGHKSDFSRAPLVQARAGFVSLIGLILTLAIVSFFVLKMVDIYVRKGVVGEDREKIMPGQKGSGWEYDGILDNIRNQVDAINKKAVQREKELENIF